MGRTGWDFDGRVTEVDCADDSQWVVWPDVADEAAWVDYALAVDWAAAVERSARQG